MMSMIELRSDCSAMKAIPLSKMKMAAMSDNAKPMVALLGELDAAVKSFPPAPSVSFDLRLKPFDAIRRWIALLEAKKR